MRNCLILALVVAIIFIFSGIVQAQTPSNDERLRKLEEICQQQEQQIERLQSQLGILQNEESYKTYTEKIVQSYLNESTAQEDDGITAGYENGFFIRSADGEFQLTMNGYFQAGLAIFENNSYEANSFYLNGAYLMFDIRLMEKWHAFIKVNFAGGTFLGQFYNGPLFGSEPFYHSYDVALADAYLEYNYRPELNFAIGNMLVPFSVEGQYAENEGISIWSEPFIQWAPNKDLGFLVHGVFANRFGYRFGIFNGDGSNTINSDDDFMMAGQFRYYLCGFDKNKESFIHVGVLSNRIEGEDYINYYFATPWGRPIFYPDGYSGRHFGVDVGAKVSVDMANGSNFRGEAEFIYNSWERAGAVAQESIYGYGFSIGAAYRHCLNKENEGSGVTVMGKFSYTDAENFETAVVADDIVGQQVLVYTVGVGYAFNKHVSVSANWVICDVDEKAYYGDYGPKDYAGQPNGSLEQAWFVQTSVWW
jgi:hypothetical protein